MTWNPRTWNKAIVKRILFAAVMLPPAVGFSNSPKHEKPKALAKSHPTSSRDAVPFLAR